jgi:Uma2 family endonuclease
MQTLIRPRPGLEMSPEEYERFALGDMGRGWELVDGRLREKPPTSIGHDYRSFDLAVFLTNHLPRDRYRVHHDSAKLERADRSYFIPDVAVTSPSGEIRLQTDPHDLNLHTDPALLVVEVWSPSTGDYDLETKIRAYQERGDLEIWRLHPFDRYLIAWRRQPDGSYTEETFHGGTLTPIALPEVTVTLDDYFV